MLDIGLKHSEPYDVSISPFDRSPVQSGSPTLQARNAITQLKKQLDDATVGNLDAGVVAPLDVQPPESRGLHDIAYGDWLNVGLFEPLLISVTLVILNLADLAFLAFPRFGSFWRPIDLGRGCMAG